MQLTVQDINNKIYTIRNEKVMIDKDLANLYHVENKVLNQAVKRNIERFPSEFMFQLTKEEFENLKSQFVTSSWGGVRKLPFVFTEHGILMLSSVLRSKIAIDINIQIMKTFVDLRKYALTHEELAKQIALLDNRVTKGEEVDNKIMDVLTQLIKSHDEQQVLKPSKTDGKIGFVK
jgi:hypothetical protein